MNELLLLAVGIASAAAWDAWNRYLKHKERVASLTNNRQDMLLKELSNLRELMTQTSDDIGSFTEKQRTILKTFLDSITDMVKLGEEDKQHLLNRLTASKLGKK